MEANPWLSPGVLVSIITSAILLITWFVRLEFKASATATRQIEYETEMDAKVKDVREEHRDVKRAYYAHAADTKVHHNEEMFKEFRVGLERRFTSIDATLQDISRKLDINR